MTVALFTGTFRSFVPVTLTSDRSGLILESGGKVKLRGVQVGRIASVTGTGRNVSVQLNIYPDAVGDIPANVDAQIKATTAFGAKYVDLIYPDDPSPQRLSAGTVLTSRNVSTEVNTVFENLSKLITKLDPVKLNATLTALAEGCAARANGSARPPPTPTRSCWRSIRAWTPSPRTGVRCKAFADAYSAAAQDILTILDSASTTSTTITSHAASAECRCCSTVLASPHSGINLLGRNSDHLVHLSNALEPTTDLLLKYDPDLHLHAAGREVVPRQRRLRGDRRQRQIGDPRRRSDVGRRPVQVPGQPADRRRQGRPRRQAGCGALPDPSKNFPVRQTGHQHRLGHRCGHSPQSGYRPSLAGELVPGHQGVPDGPEVPEHGVLRLSDPVPYPGAPPYGAPLYGPDGTRCTRRIRLPPGP